MNAALEGIMSVSSDRPRVASAELGSNRVEVWLIELDDVSAALFTRLCGVLSDDEVARANRFHFDRHRRCFVVTRGALRFLLSRHLSVAPDEICFGYGPVGKPFVVARESGRELAFNVSHAENLAVVGITQAGEIGVDLERVRELPDWEQVATATFSAEQVETLRACAEAERPEMFFRMWTREEARVKALGVGLGAAGTTRDAVGLYVQTSLLSPSFVLSFAVPQAACVLPIRPWAGEAALASFASSASGSVDQIRPSWC